MENWKEQFFEQYVDNQKGYDGHVIPLFGKSNGMDLEDFISSLLQEQRQRIVSNIQEEREKNIPAYEEVDEAYVAGLQTALNIVLEENN